MIIYSKSKAVGIWFCGGLCGHYFGTLTEIGGAAKLNHA